MRLPMTIRRAATMLSPASASTMMVPRSAIAFPGQIDALPVASSSRSNLLPRLYSTGAEASPRSSIPLEGENREQEIRVKLEEALKPTRLAIQDTSGGCGTFFNIDIESAAFQGMSKVKQHKEVMRILKEEITNEMHGVSLRTALPGQ